MKFIKDILVFQIETTGTDTERDNIIQLSGVLLDKDNLLEKNFFNSYAKVSFMDGTIMQHAEQLGITFETLQKSPKLTEVIKQFHQTFGTDCLLASHGITNILFLRQAFKKALIPFSYDPHVIDIWTLGYVYTLHYGVKKMPTFDTFLHQFHLPLANRNNALEKARLSAQVFKRIVAGV